MDEEELIEMTTTAWRPRRRDGLGSHPAWHDLSDEGRVAAYEATAELRRMEAALDQEGHSTTVRAVLSRIREG